MHTTTVGAFARRLLTVAELDLYGTPLPPVGPILEYRFSVHLAAHDGQEADPPLVEARTARLGDRR